MQSTKYLVSREHEHVPRIRYMYVSMYVPTSTYISTLTRLESPRNYCELDLYR